MHRIYLTTFLVLLSGCSTAQFLVANAPTEFDRIDRHADLPYGGEPRQHLDIYAPRQAQERRGRPSPGRASPGGARPDRARPDRARPVVIFWYGGSWVKGNKSQYRFVGTTLAERGIVAVLPDYRLYPQVTFPAFDEDGARAVAWVEQHIQQYGGDPREIVLMGHSAGGHTAAFLAFNHEFLRKFGADPGPIVGLVGLSGTYVLVPEDPTERATFPEPYTEADWQPIRFVDAHSPPALLLHGTDDTEVLPQEAVQLRDAMLALHLRVELHLYQHHGHADTVAPFAPVARWRSPALQDTLAFIESVTRH